MNAINLELAFLAIVSPRLGDPALAQYPAITSEVAAGSAPATVTIVKSHSPDQASFVAPNEPGKQVHVILEVTDTGAPPLVGDQRIVCDIE